MHDDVNTGGDFRGLGEGCAVLSRGSVVPPQSLECQNLFLFLAPFPPCLLHSLKQQEIQPFRRILLDSTCQQSWLARILLEEFPSRQNLVCL